MLSKAASMKFTSLEDTNPKEATPTRPIHQEWGAGLMCFAPSPSPRTICLPPPRQWKATVQEVTIDMITLELSNGYQHSRVSVQTPQGEFLE